MFEFIEPITAEMVKRAYKYLKTYAYNEKYNLFIKSRVAKFEYVTCKNEDDQNYEKLEEFFKDFAKRLSSKDYINSEEFIGFLNSIEIKVLPKRFEDREKTESEEGMNFYTNSTKREEYIPENYNFIIDAPIEFHLIDILWTLLVGSTLDDSLSEDCYGNRLTKVSKNFYSNFNTSLESNRIFKYYYFQYNSWRNKAIDYATLISDKNEDVAILSLDIKSFYYSLNIDFDKLPINNWPYLTQGLKLILESYNEIKKSFDLSVNKEDGNLRYTLPVGFVSSTILANYSLREFDSYVSDKVRPLYYGRYVDDILMVFKRPKLEPNNTIASFLKNYLGECINDIGDELEICTEGSININKLKVQKKKLVLQYFNKDNSKAGLSFLKKELEAKTSIIGFHNNHLDNDLDLFAYKALYNSEEEHLRNLVGITEDRVELASFLDSHILANKVCNFNKSNDVYFKIKYLFKDSNIFKLQNFWIKVYEYLFVNNRLSEACEFKELINSQIQLIGCCNDIHTRTTTVKDSLNQYNEICFNLAKALVIDVLICKDHIDQSFYIRMTNMFNHNLVLWPLINYTNYFESLVDKQKVISTTYLNIDEGKIEYSPRFIHFDEYQFLRLLQYMENSNKKDCMNNDIINDNLDKYLSRVSKDSDEIKCTPDFGNWVEFSIEGYPNKNYLNKVEIIPNDLLPTTGTEKINIKDIHLPCKHKKNKFSIGIANLNVSEEDIDNNIKGNRATNISVNRFNQLSNVLNSARDIKCDLLVLPEVSVPMLWLPYIISFSRKNRLGVIFGIEHWVSGNSAYNFMIESLPFTEKDSNYKKNIFTVRLKNHYSPEELKLIDEYHLVAPSTKASFIKTPNYHRVTWRGVSFATYNCYELANISHRAIFKNEIDLLIASVFNRDTNYYDHIMESVVRDLHCYVVQVNTSQYGGSCVLRPTRTALKKILFLKGGENECVLKATVNILDLRDFQFGKTGYSSKARPTFKGVPPGFDYEKAHKRGYN